MDQAFELRRSRTLPLKMIVFGAMVMAICGLMVASRGELRRMLPGHAGNVDLLPWVGLLGAVVFVLYAVGLVFDTHPIVRVDRTRLTFKRAGRTHTMLRSDIACVWLLRRRGKPSAIGLEATLEARDAGRRPRELIHVEARSRKSGRPPCAAYVFAYEVRGRVPAQAEALAKAIGCELREATEPGP